MTSVSSRASSTPSFANVLKAEALTARTSATTKLLLLASVVMAAVSAVANLSTVDDLASDDTLRLAMHASTVATMIFSLLAGLVATTAAFRFGSIDQRLLSAPVRSTPLAAKVIGAGATGFVFGVVGAAAAVAITASYYSFNDVAFSATSPLVTKALLGILIAAPLYAMGGAAIGFLVRNQPLAVGGSMAWLLVIEPTFIIGLPKVGKWLPGAAGVALTNSPDPGLLAQVPGGLILALFVAVVLGFAALRFRVTDV